MGEAEPLPSLLCSSPPLKLGALLIIASTELSIVVAVSGLSVREEVRIARAALDLAGIHEVSLVETGVFVLLDQLFQRLVPRVHQLDRREFRLVLHARVRPGFQHHLHQGVSELALGGRLRVDPSDGGVEWRVTLYAVYGIALEVRLVEEEVYYLVCFPSLDANPLFVCDAICKVCAVVPERGVCDRVSTVKWDIGKSPETYNCPAKLPRGRGGCP